MYHGLILVIDSITHHKSVNDIFGSLNLACIIHELLTSSISTRHKAVMMHPFGTQPVQLQVSEKIVSCCYDIGQSNTERLTTSLALHN